MKNKKKTYICKGEIFLKSKLKELGNKGIWIPPKISKRKHPPQAPRWNLYLWLCTKAQMALGFQQIPHLVASTVTCSRRISQVALLTGDKNLLSGPNHWPKLRPQEKGVSALTLGVLLLLGTQAVPLPKSGARRNPGIIMMSKTLSLPWWRPLALFFWALDSNWFTEPRGNVNMIKQEGMYWLQEGRVVGDRIEGEAGGSSGFQAGAER